MKNILWHSKTEEFKNTELFLFKSKIENKLNKKFSNYSQFWQWSVNQKKDFWSELWDYFNVIGNKGDVTLKNENDFINSEWYPNGTLNYAENILELFKKNRQSKANKAADLIFWGEDRVEILYTFSEFEDRISQTAQALKQAGLKKGDRVCAMVPNHPDTLVAMFATVSLGGIWTSCSPDFGVQGVLDRFTQVQPKFFISCDGYFYNSKEIDCLDKTIAVMNQLSSLEKTIVIGYLNKSNLNKDKLVSFESFISAEVAKKIDYEKVSFNYPLFIMYSSGTTGIPKCIVHGHGGTLLQHLKEQRLHSDLRSNDTLFYFTTCGWMMWNWLVSGFSSGARIMLYDGSPFHKSGQILFDYAEKYKCTHFGTSAKFIDSCLKADLKPSKTNNLDSIKVILSTGSPLSAEGFDYVYHNISSKALLASISGGTDILSCFVLGSPWTDVFRGEISVPGLGMDVDIWDENERSIIQEKGELVCKSTFPSKPIGFWNDPDKKKFSQAYFEKFKNIWCHGDYVEKTQSGGFVIHGRSDATLNPGGVRIGTAEIYRQVESIDEVLESIVIGQNWQSDVRVILFVKLKDHFQLDSVLIEKIKNQIRKNTTPRHVPAKILQVKDIPRTKSGKIVELAVRQIVHGETVKNAEALANPEALGEFANRSELTE